MLSCPQTFLLAAVIFIFYFILFCWLVTKLSFFKNSGLGNKWLIGLFTLKIIAGCVYAWFYALPAYEHSSDTWIFFSLSKEETAWLKHDPSGFLQDLFTYGYNKSGNLFAGENSYWNDLKNNIIIKLMAIFNVFTGTNYFANLVCFNFLYFFGPVAFYRMMHTAYTTKKTVLIFPVFFIPSFLFWCSGMHKEGLIFSTLSLAVYAFYAMLQQKKRHWKYAVIFFVSLVALFALRNFIVLLLIPAFTAWLISNRFASYKWLVFLGVYVAVITIFFSAKYFYDPFDFPQYIIAKQSEFNQLPGNSQISIPPLKPTIQSFVYFFPYAIDIAFLRPHITEGKNFSYIPAAIENIIVVFIVIVCLILKSKRFELKPMILFCLFFSVSFLFLAGYTITFSGSIVRYKSVVLPLLLSPFFIMADVRKVKF